ncbi:DUF3429 domain-containing protein [Roseomonas stagni]|uniref:DUF3429 domain-containing protein n=1 Tax=Falsiroseomonas algicola TaxID=2716930 RepID=A0A6M1LNJ3_9PROT|nr:DUF3429 domain-containing protein [Falsiroseomonas algicola]NGM21951.1 DUF3429 domain-containing protein [Falsiroseomonas algicola]
MNQPLPPSALLLGAAGLIPFLGLTAATALSIGWAPPALAAYGAAILAFLGAVHWGLALRAPESEAGATTPRLALGVLPSLIAWIALLLPLRPGLALLAAGILATAAVEARGAARGLVPPAYMRLRWVLSLTAAASLGLGALLA